MAFKSLAQYQEDKNGEFFVLPNDGDYADVIFLYRSVDDVLVADVHYIMSSVYKGYAHCCGTGCPACNYVSPGSKYRGIKLDHKIFIPLYNITKNKIEFWDRSTFFEQVLQKHVFGPYPNPSQIVFRITRRGEAGSRDTKYDIDPKMRNNSRSYEQILSDFGITLPEAYDHVVKEMSISEMSAALSSAGSPASDLEDYNYVPVPRGAASNMPEAVTPEVSIDLPAYSAPPEAAPPTLPDYDPTMTDIPSVDEGDDSGDSLDDVAF